MRFLAMFLFCVSAHAEECGLYQVEDYGERTNYTIIDFVSAAPQSVNYRIINQDAVPVKSMLNGLCYCVDGEIAPDPSYPGDSMYQLLSVKHVVSGPSWDCTPSK